MDRLTYEVVRHDTGWAYKVGDVFSETFATHEEAHRAAEDAAERQQLDGETTNIEFEDENGVWHHEVASGADYPVTEVADEAAEADTRRD